jgi:hypothetical protein
MKIEEKCRDCGQPFTIDESAQEWFHRHGFTHLPRRCRPCRAARRAAEECETEHEPPKAA